MPQLPGLGASIVSSKTAPPVPEQSVRPLGDQGCCLSHLPPSALPQKCEWLAPRPNQGCGLNHLPPITSSKSAPPAAGQSISPLWDTKSRRLLEPFSALGPPNSEEMHQTCLNSARLHPQSPRSSLCQTPVTASERRGNNLRGFYLKAKAITWL